MAGNRYVPTIFTALDTNGAPLPGAKLYFYENETTTPKNTWSDIDLATANAWPVVADASGRFTVDIFLDVDPYRIKLTDASDVQIWLKDDCNTFNNGTGNGDSFPFPGAVIDFYGTQDQLDVATSLFWYLFDGANSLPNLNGRYIKTCLTVGTIGTIGGSNSDITPSGTAASHILTLAEIPSHTHKLIANENTADGSPSLATTQQIVKANTSGVDSSYTLNGTSTSATIGDSGASGGGSGHTHTLTVTPFNAQPAFYQLIKLVYLGY